MRMCRDFWGGCAAAAEADAVWGRGGAGDRQRSHLTLHVLNRLKDFFFFHSLSQISPAMPEAWRRLVRIIKIDDIE